MTRTAIYTRISRDDDGDALGVKRQERDCRQLADTKGYDVVDVLSDNDLSAYNGKRRPSYDRLLEGLRDGTYDAVIAWKFDRLSRTGIRGLTPLLDALDGRPLVCVMDSVDTSTPMGEGVAGMIASMAKQEAKNTGDRVRRKKDELAEAGRPAGGSRAFGFTADGMHHDKREARLIREAVRRLLSGESLAAVARDWNRRKVPQVAGGAGWVSATLRRIITAPRIAGLRVHRGQIVGPAAWKPIVSRDDFEALQVRVAAKKGQPKRRSFLTGIVHCAECGQPMVRDVQYHRRVWRCRPRFQRPGCGKVSCPADPLEEIITEALLTAVDGPGLARMRAATNTGAGEELAAAEAALRDLAELFGAGTISQAEWLTARRGAEERAETARRKLADDSAGRALTSYATPGALRATWPTLDVDQRRTILTAVIERVDVAKGAGNGARFDAERIEPIWRA
ncbi:MAG: recombinase family protein [Actinomycetota bacterium]|nr:recombinase family protein [Actinomycetota bacterium]